MTWTKALLSSAFLILLVLSAAPSWADSVPVQNASFASSNSLTTPFGGGPYNLGPIPNWNTSGVAGSWAPNSTEFSSIPGGTTIGFTNDGTISQTLTGFTVLPGTLYTLSVFVGDRLDGASGNFTIALDAGSTTLCTFSGSSASITAGTFADETCTFQSGAVVPSGDLSVVLTGTSPGMQLDVSTVSVNTPEPGSLALTAVGLLFGCLFFAFRRKQTA